jgi:1,4-dihydroxy-6-naphthoate synthase
MGEQYGPMVVVREGAAIEPAQLPSLRVAVPGLLTSAFLELQLAVGRIPDPVITPFDRILDVVEAGEVDAGLVIHEGQLTYETQGLVKILDLGEWWHELTGGLPLPLGANAVRRDLDEGDTLPRLSRLLRDSIAYGLEHRTGALAHAERFGRGLDMDLADRFVGMYVNDRTLDYGEDGRAAVAELLRRGHEAGLIDRAPRVDFVED